MHQTTLENLSIKILVGLDGSIRINVLDIRESLARRVTSVESNVNLQQSVTWHNKLAGLSILKRQ